MKILILAALVASSAMGTTIILTMDEAPTQFIDGLVINKAGFGFTFSDPGAALRYNVKIGVAHGVNTQGPVIEGNNSTFAVAFALPMFHIRFGYAVNSLDPVGIMATVALFNDGPLPFVIMPVNSTATDPYASGLFAYDGDLGSVTKMVITPTGANFTAIAMDNLTVDPTVPEPANLGLGAVCLAGLLLRRKYTASTAI